MYVYVKSNICTPHIISRELKGKENYIDNAPREKLSKKKMRRQAKEQKH